MIREGKLQHHRLTQEKKENHVNTQIFLKKRLRIKMIWKVEEIVMENIEIETLEKSREKNLF